MLSRVLFFAIPWTVASEAPPSMGFSRQEYWSSLPCPPPGNLPDPGIEPASPPSLWHLLRCRRIFYSLSPLGFEILLDRNKNLSSDQKKTKSWFIIHRIREMNYLMAKYDTEKKARKLSLVVFYEVGKFVKSLKDQLISEILKMIVHIVFFCELD